MWPRRVAQQPSRRTDHTLGAALVDSVLTYENCIACLYQSDTYALRLESGPGFGLQRNARLDACRVLTAIIGAIDDLSAMYDAPPETSIVAPVMV